MNVGNKLKLLKDQLGCLFYLLIIILSVYFTYKINEKISIVDKLYDYINKKFIIDFELLMFSIFAILSLLISLSLKYIFLGIRKMIKKKKK